MHSRQVKTVCAAVGAAALLSMGVLVVATEQISAAEPLPLQQPTTTPEITTGETSTETRPPQEPETSVATPEITTPPSSIGQEPAE